MTPWILIGAGVLALLAATRIPPPLPPELAPLTVTRTGLDNLPPPEVWGDLARLARFIDGLRSRYGQVEIRSAYRSPAVNRAVGGVTDSLHLAGRAVDFTLPGQADAVRSLFRSWVAEPFRIAGLVQEAILTDVAGAPPWLHVGLAAAGLAPAPKLIQRTVTGARTLTG